MNAIVKVGRRIIGLHRQELARLRDELKALRTQRDAYEDKLGRLVDVRHLDNPIQDLIHLQVSVDKRVLREFGGEFVAERVAKELVNRAFRAGNGSTAGSAGGDRRPTREGK